tara:strand:+ start:993 stop:1358 length:366 start_codon:yes stop_codon:yes gene_type:complete
MSGMHLMPVYYTDTNLKKRKKRKVTASMQKAQAEQDKYLKKLGYVPLEQRQKEFKPLRLDKLWDNYDNRVSIPTSDKVGNGLKKSKPLYTGNAVVGQAYNKGGLQVLSTQEIKDPSTGKRR